MKKKIINIAKAIGLAFLIAENRFFTFADREDRIILLLSFAVIFGYVIYLYDGKTLYKNACEKQAERRSHAVQKAIRRDTRREYLDNEPSRYC